MDVVDPVWFRISGRHTRHTHGCAGEPGSLPEDL
jgi:hypothetical protein